MTSPEHIRRLFAYTRWANRKTLEAVAPLTADELNKPIGGSFGSVQGTLHHLYGADWVWLERFHGRSPRALPDPDEAVTLAVLSEKWRHVQDGHRDFIERLDPDCLKEKLTYVNFAGESWSYPVGEALIHLANHGTYHRGQVATLLRQLGRSPIPTDYLRYIDAGSPV